MVTRVTGNASGICLRMKAAGGSLTSTTATPEEPSATMTVPGAQATPRPPPGVSRRMPAAAPGLPGWRAATTVRLAMTPGIVKSKTISRMSRLAWRSLLITVVPTCQYPLNQAVTGGIPGRCRILGSAA